MKLIRIDHVSLNAADRDATIAWYGEVLGLRAPAGATPPDQPVFLGTPQARLAVRHRSSLGGGSERVIAGSLDSRQEERVLQYEAGEPDLRVHLHSLEHDAGA